MINIVKCTMNRTVDFEQARTRERTEIDQQTVRQLERLMYEDEGLVRIGAAESLWEPGAVTLAADGEYDGTWYHRDPEDCSTWWVTVSFYATRPAYAPLETLGSIVGSSMI